MEMTDVSAVSRAIGGDSEAFRLLVERHSRTVFKVAYRMTGNEHDADDVVQETFLRVYRQLEKFESRANFTTWLHRIAVNCSLDLLRTRTRHDKHRSKDAEEALMNGEVATEQPHAERLLLSSEVQHQVSTALETLSGNERTAFVLRHFEGMSIEEIGSVLGTRVNATKNTIFRAVRKLRDQLEPLVRTTSCNT
jgi:RNA polymerase sigma-70 factor (ECF subfamily)